MRRIVLFLVLTCPALSQTYSRNRIPPDEAATHLIKHGSPVYPELARVTRITGPVIFEIIIDESGKPSVHRAVYGHPLLTGLASDYIKSWRYQPFLAEGKPVSVFTLVMVPFSTTKGQGADSCAEMLFQHNSWKTVESARVLLDGKNYESAAQQQNQAQDLLGPADHGLASHRVERVNWMMTMGDLRRHQSRYDDSEEYYKKALTITEQATQKESPDKARVLAKLGQLYSLERKYDLSRECATKSIAILNGYII